MMFTTVHLHPVVERLSRNEGGGGVCRWLTFISYFM